MIYELTVQSTIPICWSLSGLRLLCLEPNCFALLPPTAEFENQPVYIIIANILGRF